MWQGRRWIGAALPVAVAATLCLGCLGQVQTARAGTSVLDLEARGSVEAGGMYSFGERNSSKFKDYRDMDNGFLGELTLKGEKKDSPYYFDIWLKNPARDDQAYEGALGRFGLFELELGWDRTRHVISNTGQTMFQQNGNDFTIPASLRNTITTTPAGYIAGTAANCVGITNWTCPYPVGSAVVPVVGNAQYLFIQNTINGLTRPVDLGFNTDVGLIGLKLTPTEELRFDFEYNNRRNEGYRPLGTNVGSMVELAVPIDQTTHEMKFGAEFARPNYAFQFGYTGSFFRNEFQSYTWDNPNSVVTQSGLTNPTARTANSAKGEVSAAPDNEAHTFSLTGRGSLPWWRTNLSGAFSYTMLRQDQTFLYNIPVAGTGLTRRNTDDAGNSSPDAKSDLVAGNFLLTTRPISSVTMTARYRYFELQNDTPLHTFTNLLAPAGTMSFNTGTGSWGTAATGTTHQERYTRQNLGGDVSWRPFRQVALKGEYGFERWNRGDFDGKNFGTEEHTAKGSVTLTPLNWLLGRLGYVHGVRRLSGDYGNDPASGIGFYKYNYADRVRDRVDAQLQFTPWETLTPSLNFGYARDNYNRSAFGLTDDENFSAGASLSWSPYNWLTLTTDYTYERHDTTQRSPGGTTGWHVNDFESASKDEFHTVGANLAVDVIPKKFDVNLGYGVTFGYTTIKAFNLNPGFTTAAGNFPKIQNVLQTVRVVGRYRLTEKLSVRGGFAYERFNEKNYARDPMQPFMGWYDSSGTGILSTFLGATTPNYESYTLGALVRYDF